MEKDDGMKTLMKQVVSNFISSSGLQPVSPDAFVPRGPQTKEFFKNLVAFLSTLKQIIYKKWERFFTISYVNALSTHEMYLRYVMFACDIESKFSDNIFEKILGVLALVMSYNYETLISAGTNFCKFSVSIFMVYYKNNLKESFCRQGGFEQFAEYLHRHYSFPGENQKQDLPDSDVHSSKRPSPLKRVKNKTENLSYNPNLITHLDVVKNAKCKSLAKEVISTTGIKSTVITDPIDLKYKMQEGRRLKAAAGNLHWTVQTLDTPSDAETASKREKTGKISKCDALKGVSKSKVITRVQKARKRFPQCKSTKDASKSEAVKEIAMEGTSELEKNDTTSKDGMTETSQKIGKTETASKYETTEAALKSETTNATSELKDRKRKETETASNREATERVLNQCTNRESEVQGSKEVQLEEKLDWCEDIVRRVIKYNNSKRADSADPSNRIQREVDKFLKQMTDILKSLIDVLEDLYEE